MSGRRVRVGRAVAGWAVGCAVAAGVPVLRGESAADVAEAQAVKQTQEQAAKQAVEQLREQHIAQLAQQMQLVFQPALQAELERVRKTCGSLPADARKKIAAASNETVTVVARQWAERQLGGQGVRQGFDPRKSIHEAVAAAVKPHATAEEFATYQREQAARVARRVREARIKIVTKLDRELELSQSQRQKIEADLETHWEAGWLRELDDNGSTMINNFRPAPDFADKCIAPHLDDRQRGEWTTWCQKAGWQHVGKNFSINFNFDGRSMQSDPWWSK